MSLSQRQKKLEEMLACPYARGQVYIRNLIDPAKREQGPHLALRCRIREFLGAGETILGLEKIILTCCREPQKTCEAYRAYSEKEAG